MEDDLEGEKMKQPELENKTKRKMKTASQLEILEKTYAVETYPSESVRGEGGVRADGPGSSGKRASPSTGSFSPVTGGLASPGSSACYCSGRADGLARQPAHLPPLATIDT